MANTVSCKAKNVIYRAKTVSYRANIVSCRANTVNCMAKNVRDRISFKELKFNINTQKKKKVSISVLI